MDEPTCPGCRDLLQRLAALEARVKQLTDELEAAKRAGKRQAAPFRKGSPKTDPKTPGRKEGEAHGPHGHRPTPDHIDECHEAPLPDACPHCQGQLVESEIVDQYQTEIPRQPIVRQFRIHVGHCACCGKRTQGRHELQTSDALGAAASQIGPDAQAAAALLHTQAGLSYGKVSSVFQTLFGIKLTRGAGAQINLRAADGLEADYQLILQATKQSPELAVDETGWRTGGHPAWLHVWVGERATAYAIDPHRSADALQEVIGLDWSGILGHDGLATYERFGEVIHQQCLAHLIRRARDLRASAQGGATRFPQQVIDLFTEAVHLRNQYHRGIGTREHLQLQREIFDDRLLELVKRPRQGLENIRLANHLKNHFEQWFACLFNPQIEATNWKAEQAIRPAVVNRKVWGGNRTEAGAKAQGILMSVFETCRRQLRFGLDYLSYSFRQHGNLLLPKPILLT